MYCALLLPLNLERTRVRPAAFNLMSEASLSRLYRYELGNKVYSSICNIKRHKKSKIASGWLTCQTCERAA